jgi:hypothetical protein
MKLYERAASLGWKVSASGNWQGSKKMRAKFFGGCDCEKVLDVSPSGAPGVRF